MMRRNVRPLVLLSVCALGGAALAGCQALAPDRTAGEPVHPPAVARPAQDTKGGGAAVAALGDAVDLGGRASGEHLRMSVRAYVDPAVAVPGKDGTAAVAGPPDGKRRIGVSVALLNVGGHRYDARRTKTWVTDTKGGRHPAVTGGEITTGSPVEWNILAAGEAERGWLLFDVPESAYVTEFHGDLGKSAVEWRLQAPPSR
ncbi:hypothetical protein AB0G74_13190 [Streptomyces sp. NPDC020875]|uniref:hypothetical protein n=1 Tax=Streptomyces sp. NPDC020875 TaxID=3154898 RepID=UPI0033F8C716